MHMFCVFLCSNKFNIYCKTTCIFLQDSVSERISKISATEIVKVRNDCLYVFSILLIFRLYKETKTRDLSYGAQYECVKHLKFLFNFLYSQKFQFHKKMRDLCMLL